MQNENTNDQTPMPVHDFERLTDGLKSAISKFQSDQSPENLAGIVTALSGFGVSGMDIWQKVAQYAKQYPVRTALGAGLVFFAAKGLIGEQSRLQNKLH